MKSGDITRLIASFVFCFAAAALGSAFTVSEISTWYAGLNKPPFNPPNWIFGPVWSLLYTMMAVALYIVWSSKAKKRIEAIRKLSLQYFILQLLLNSMWSIVFFGLHAPLAAFFVIIALWGAIAQTVRTLLRVQPIAGYLMVPYLAWVSFALILNLSVVLLN